MSRNLLLTLEYDGTNYLGWQRQPAYQGMSVQQRVEQALAEVLGQRVVVHGAGRTDAGVHALGQCCSFLCPTAVPLEKLPDILNHRLPGDIRVSRAREMGADFHARFSAQGKHYRYLIEQQAPASAFRGRFSWQLEEELDLEAMEQAAAYLVGEHDFRYFTVRGCESKTFIRCIHRLSLTRPPAGEGGFPWQGLRQPLALDAEGNGFLYKMVRIIMGRLVAVGRRRLPPQVMEDFLRGSGPPNIPPAPPQGLMLMEVKYPENI